MSRRRQHRPNRVRAAGPFKIDITDLAADARGVGHAEGKAVFVADTLPGEQISYMRTRQHRNHDEGQLVEITQASPERVETACEYFGVCGGCALQHLAPEAQIEFKQNQLTNNLQRIGKVVPQHVLTPIRGPLWGYRRRARLAVRFVPAKGGALVGFRERSGGHVTVMRSCEVLATPVAKQLPALQALVERLSIRERLPQIEVAVADNAIALVFRVLEPPSENDIAELKQYARDTGFELYLQPDGEDSVAPLSERVTPLYYDLPAQKLRIGFEPLDFVQINAQVNADMVTQAMDLLALDPSDHVLELFAGIGNFSLPLAQRVRQVTSIEGEPGLVQRAIDNAANNGVQNLNARQADLFGGQARVTAALADCDFNKVLLDPPRAGAREVIAALAQRKPSHILYCSCHPATLARDAGVLVHEFGYTLTQAGVMDMFPHTAHVEAMALFERL